MAGTISSAGIGSGLDVSTIINKLMAAEQGPLTKLQTQAQSMQTQLSAFGQMQSLVSSFRDAAAALYAPDLFSLTSAGSSDSTTVAASSSPSATPGVYSVAVSSLASTQTVVSTGGQFQAATDTVGTGSMTIRLGSWSADDPPVFAAKAGSKDIVIPIGADAATLTGIRDKINAAQAGVSASIITDASGARLSLQSNASGADNGFRVTVQDDDDTGDGTGHTDTQGLSRLAFDPGAGVKNLKLTQAAGNTQATINGIAVSSTGSTLSGVVEGMTFTLSKVTTTPAIVTVTRNTDAVKKSLGAFVAAYNQLETFFDQTTSYDAANQQAGLLQGDSTAVGVQRQMRMLIGQPGSASSVFGTLSSLGVEFQKDGSLKLNDSKVNAALGNLSELKKALAADAPGQPAASGFARSLTTWADKMLGTNGALQSRTKSIESRLKSNQKDQATASDRLTATEARLRAQYSALDSTMAKANALQQYVSQQITSWNNIKVST